MYYWNEETISHFQFVSNYISKNCQMEVGDTEEMLANDLMNKVYS